MTDTVRTMDALLNSLFQDGQQAGSITPQDIRDLVVSSIGTTGWASYTDTQYTDVAPLLVSGNTDTQLPNNAGASVETELPLDRQNGLYDSTNQIILGQAGDALMLTLEFITDRVSASGDYTVDVWLDIGGSVGRLFERSIQKKGSGPENVSVTTGAFNLATWQANGASVNIRSTVNINVYGILYRIFRIHKGRGTYT